MDPPECPEYSIYDAEDLEVNTKRVRMGWCLFFSHSLNSLKGHVVTL